MDHVEETVRVLRLDPTLEQYIYRLDCVDSLFSRLKELFTISVEGYSDSVPEGERWDICYFESTLLELESLHAVLDVVSLVQVLCIFQEKEPDNELYAYLEEFFLKQEETHDLEELDPVYHGIVAKRCVHTDQSKHFWI